MRTPPRRLYAAAALAAAAAAVLAGCSGGSDTGSTESAEPVTGGDVTFAVSSAFGTFDPNITASAPDARVVRQVFDSLVDLTEDGEIVPWLATEWQTSADGLTYTFTLRDDVAFHDGTPFDAAAVCGNFDRIVAPETASLYAVSLIGPYAGCEAPDATTAVVTLSSPYAPFLANLSTPFLGIVSPTAAEAAGVADFGLAPVGTGPFVFESYTPDSEVVLTRNDDYAWPSAVAEHEGAAHLDSLTFQIITDATVRLGSLRSGDVQGIGDVPAQEVAGVESDETLSYHAPAQAGAVFQLFYNTTVPGLDDPAVRRAMTAAMDVDTAVAATYFGAYETASSPLSPATSGYDESLSRVAFDTDAAAEELDAAGWTEGADGIREKDGVRLSYSILMGTPSYDSRVELLEFLRDAMDEIGVELDVEAVSATQVGELYAAGDYDLVTTSFVAVDPDILYTLYHSSSYFNMAHIDTLDADLEEARAMPTGEERDALYSEIQAQVLDEAYSVPVYQLSFHVATTAGLGGLGFDAAAYPTFYDAFLAE